MIFGKRSEGRTQTSGRGCGIGMRVLAVGLAAGLIASPLQAAQGCFRGVNLSGAEFGEPDGLPFQNYIYPSEETIRYFAGKGFTSVRLPFKWERLQPTLNGDLAPEEVERLRSTVALLRQSGIRTVIDPHNFGYYRNKQVGTADVPDAAFADFWGRLAALFANDPDITFGLMNEPFDMPARQWLQSANAAIASIRATGAGNLILVPGTVWSGAHSWESGHYGGANGEVMLGVVDPVDNYAYEVHQYFDDDFSGTKDNCSRAGDAIGAIESFTRWLRKNGKRGYLGEFGVPGEEACIKALDGMVSVVESNRDLWTGWAYWAAGDWWPEAEALNIQPTASGDRAQLAGLSRYLKDFSASSGTCAALDRR